MFEQNSMQSRPLERRAFTLLELLAVVVVMSLLGAMLLGSMTRAKSIAGGTLCRGNLRQWGVATLLFATDNDGYLPKDGAPNGTWTDGGWYIDLPRAIGIPVYSDLAWRTNASINPGMTPWICPVNRR